MNQQPVCERCGLAGVHDTIDDCIVAMRVEIVRREHEFRVFLEDSISRFEAMIEKEKHNAESSSIPGSID